MAGDDPKGPKDKFVSSSTNVTAVVPPVGRSTTSPGIPAVVPHSASGPTQGWTPPAFDEQAASALPAPIEGTVADFQVRIAANLTVGHPELSDLIKECSGLTFSRGQLVAVSQRAAFVEMIDPTTLVHRRVELPRGGALAAAGLRAGATLELEAVVATRDWRGDFLMAFGAGTHPGVQRVVRMRVGAGEMDLSVVEAQRLYRALWELPGLATSALNIEGAAWVRPQGAPAVIRLCHRGNGKARGNVEPASATVDIRLDVLIAYLERARRNPDAQMGDDVVSLRRYRIGAVDGVAYGFSDACGLADGRMLFVAAAERCVDVGIPGKNYGTALGVIDGKGALKWAPIREADGSVSTSKAAALTIDDGGNVYVALAGGREAPRLVKLEIEGKL